MILELLEADHQAIREIIAEVGNSPQPSDEERLTKLQHWQQIWKAHQAILEQAVYPEIMQDLPDREPVVGKVRQAHAQVLELLDRTCRQTIADDPVWPESFEELREAHEREYDIEMTHLASQILSELNAEQIARLSRKAREVHTVMMTEA